MLFLKKKDLFIAGDGQYGVDLTRRIPIHLRKEYEI